MVGLSGLITPSLDQMVDVATRDGAAAARAAAADRRRDDVAAAHGREDRARVLERDRARARREPGHRRRLAAARSAAPRSRSTSRTASCRSGCASSTPRRCASRCSRSRMRARNRHASAYDELPAPPFIGTRDVEPTLAELVPYIDWQFFFHAWDLKGKFPAILDQPAARELYDDAHGAARRDRRSDSSLQARGVYGFWPAHADGDDVVVDGARASASCASRPTTATAARTAASPTSSRRTDDHLGAFAVVDPRRRRARGALRGGARRLPGDHRQGARRPPRRGVRRMAPRARAPRVVRARRAPVRRRARRERFRGIRPAFGYPACPDHSEKAKLFELLGAERCGHRR